MRRSEISERLDQAFAECIEDVSRGYNPSDLRSKLKLARMLLGMTQRQFANAFGIPPATVRNWEADSRPLPSGAAATLIDIIFDDPILALEKVEKARSLAKNFTEEKPTSPIKAENEDKTPKQDKLCCPAIIRQIEKT